jgi:hypothetical protein
MSANTYLQVSDLDFNSIRDNLKNFLSSQTQFKDYDFEGSAMAVLLDVLSYNTHYNSYYLNMIANEMFMDTAQIRDSIVSRAKEIGYTPTSAKGASALITVTFEGIDEDVTQFTIDRNSKFTTTIDDIQYTFVTPDAYLVTRTATGFSQQIEIVEGEPLTHRFNVGANRQRYVLPNQNVDTSSIVVRVQESANDSTTTEFVRASNVREVNNNSNVYFLQEGPDQKFELEFGDGVLGKALRNGNIVIVDYIVCNAGATNGANSFTIDDLLTSEVYTKASITVDKQALGGREIESIESIKFNAPRFFETQNRAVVNSDYKRILLNENSDLQSVVAFGGEDADRPTYGKVYIAVKPFGEQFVTQNRKTVLRRSILDRTPLAIDPVIIDGDYMYIVPTISTIYDSKALKIPTSSLVSLIRSRVREFSELNLERFGNRLRFSRFVDYLDRSDSSILNNDVSILLSKRFAPDTVNKQRVFLKFNNPIRPGSLESTAFSHSGYATCYIEDDRIGNVSIYRFDNNKNKLYVEKNLGTVDYSDGILEINDFAPTAYEGSTVNINALPDRLDIVPQREQILIMDHNNTSIGVVGELAE